MNKPFEIAVVGAGTAGLCVALRLAKSAHRCAITVYDAGERPAFDLQDDIALRVSALSQGSQQLLSSIGAWQHVATDRICAFDRMRVWDELDDPHGDAGLSFAADEFAVPVLGYIVENGLLQQALQTELMTTDSECQFGRAVINADFDADRPVLEFENGVQRAVDLVIAADGARSVMRELAGIAVKTHDYQQVAVVTHLQCEQPHRDTAWQRFLRDGPVGILPLADGRISIVWSTSQQQADTVRDLSDKELGDTLTEVTDAVLGQLTVGGPRGSFPLRALHAERYVQRGLALIGDAAHNVHPLAGQGANLGFADADELAATLVSALDNGDVASDRPILRRYERARRGENGAMLKALTGLNALYASNSALTATLRRAGTTLFANSGPLRRRVVGIALGGTRR